MAKTKTPFFGLGSQGSIGGTVTTQKRHQLTMVRSKPAPAYRYTLPQAYQRWLYEDYAYLWRQQTTAIKQQYATAGSHYHLTGFQYWMRIQLSLLPDITGWWRFDHGTGATAMDSSKNRHLATIIGATPSDGVIQRALSFDGTNDFASIPLASPVLDGTGAFTIELLFKFKTPLPAAAHRLCIKRVGGNAVYLYTNGAAPWRLRAWVTGLVPNSFISNHIFTPGIWHHAALTYDLSNLALYLDGQSTLLPVVGTRHSFDTLTYLATNEIQSIFSPVDLDNVIIYNRSLDSTEIQRHSERRYPA